MPKFTTRPVILGRRGVVASGHYLATAAGFRILERGGNAFDAAVATGLCLALLEPHNNGLGGEVPILLYSAREQKVYALSGQGFAPRRATIEWFCQNQYRVIPGDGFLPATVPAAMDTWILTLSRFGTKTLAEVAAPALELAEEGFPIYETMREALEQFCLARFRQEWPSSAAIYLPRGALPEVGWLCRNPDWAQTLRQMIRAERAAVSRGRRRALQAARNVFYQGAIAERICDFIQSVKVRDAEGGTHYGLLRREDFADFRARLETPVHLRYRDTTVFKCPPWSQGPVFLQQLAILGRFPLRKLGHNSADYIHLVIEAAKLAFADREKFYGDPDFDDVPLRRLLSPTYGAAQARRIDWRRAGAPEIPSAEAPRLRRAGTHDHDTTHLDVADAAGNMISCTPSGGWIQSSPVIEGLGFPLGTRAQMFYLDPARPNALAPRKRPRTTLTPSLAFRRGRPWLVFGTPGGDQQDQWTLQFFLNIVDFGMNLQEAMDAPSFHTAHFPSSFYPRTASPREVVVEGRIPTEVRSELERRGHRISVAADWFHGKVTAVARDHRGLLYAGASAKGEVGYAFGW